LSLQFSATIGGGYFLFFLSPGVLDENSGAMNSVRPLLPLWAISCVCRKIIQTYFITNVVFLNILKTYTCTGTIDIYILLNLVLNLVICKCTTFSKVDLVS